MVQQQYKCKDPIEKGEDDYAGYKIIATKANKLENFSFAKLAVLMLSLGVTLRILASCMKIIAELDPDEKNRISHRGKALQLMKEILADKIQ